MKINDLATHEKIAIYAMVASLPYTYDCANMNCSHCPYGIFEEGCLLSLTGRNALRRSYEEDLKKLPETP